MYTTDNVIEPIPRRARVDTDRQAGATYRIEIQGSVDGRWSDWFGGMDIVPAQGRDGTLATTLVGPVADQAALRGILNRLWDLNLTLVSVTQVDQRWEGGSSNGIEDAHK
jgi:hypothetical protein